MAFYTIDFTVTAAGISPDAPQFAGYTGDHRAAVVRFSVPFEGYGYRLELIDGSGVYDTTGLLEINGGAVSYEIPSAWTAAGVAALRLVAVEQGEDGSETVRFHAAPAYLRFEDREDGEPLGEHLRPAWQETLDEAQFFLTTVEQKLENGELDGKDGEKGDKGDAGYTPQKGIDYYTDAEREALIAELGARDVDQELGNSPRAVANWAVLEKFIEHENWLLDLSGYDYTLYTRLEEVDERLVSAEHDISNMSMGLHEIEQQIGEIETALDSILAIQDALIGGASA